VVPLVPRVEARQDEQHTRHHGEQAAGSRHLLAVVYLLPGGELAGLALVLQRPRGALQHVHEHERRHVVDEVGEGPGEVDGEEGQAEE